jgi:hypothetical protein
MAENSSLAKIQGMGGVLGTSAEEIQNLAGQAGLQAAPTTAPTQAMIGANADQAKMAGTPAQMTKAIQMSLRPEETAGYQARVETGRTTAKAGDAAQALPESLKQLIGLGGKVAETASAEMARVAEDTLVGTTGVNKSYLDGVILGSDGKTDTAKVTSILNAVNAWQEEKDPTKKLANLQALQTLVGDKNMPKMFGISEGDWIKKLQDALPNDVTMKQLMGSGAGAAAQLNISDLSSFTGIPAEELEGKSWGEVKQAVNQKLTDRYANVEQLKAQSNDLSLPANVRNTAQQRLRELGVAGAVSVAEQAKTLEQQIEAGDNITFDGKEMEVGEFLNDPDIATTLKGLLEGNIDPKSLKGTPYEKLLDIGTKYQEELSKKYGTDVSGPLAQASTNVKKYDEDITALGLSGPINDDIKGLLGITEDMKSGLAPFAQNEYYTQLMGLGEAERSTILAQLGPDAKEYLDMKKKDGTAVTTADINAFQAAATQYNALNGAVDIPALLAQLAPGVTDVNTDFDAYDIDLPEVIDTNHDGIIDTDTVTKINDLPGDAQLKLIAALNGPKGLNNLKAAQTEITNSKITSAEETSFFNNVKGIVLPKTVAEISSNPTGVVTNIDTQIGNVRQLMTNLDAALATTTNSVVRNNLLARKKKLTDRITELTGIRNKYDRFAKLKGTYKKTPIEDIQRKIMNDSRGKDLLKKAKKEAKGYVAEMRLYMKLVAELAKQVQDTDYKTSMLNLFNTGRFSGGSRVEMDVN